MLKTTLKAIFVVGLLYFLVRRGLVSFQDTRRALEDWPRSVSGLAALAATLVLAAWRWQLLLRAQGISVAWWRAMQLTMIGAFFNVALPGAISGDFIKVFQMSKGSVKRRDRALGSILFDRAVGVSALVLVSATALLLERASPAGMRFPPALELIVCAVASGLAIFYAYFFLVSAHRDPLLGLLRRIESRLPKFGAFTRIYGGIRRYRGRGRVVALAAMTSGLTYLLVGWACYRFALALGETGLPLLAVCAIVPIALFVNVFRVSPAGVGTGHAAFLFLFGLAGSRRGADIFSLFVISDLIFATVGGLIYLRFRREAAVPMRELAAGVPCPPIGSAARRLG